MSHRPFYKNTGDVLAEVGITARQITYWRKEGLFTPQLGDIRRYTAGDIAELKYLKKLIDPREGYGFSIEAVRRLFKSVGGSVARLHGLLDLESGELKSDYQLFDEVIHGDGDDKMLLDMDVMEEAILMLTLKLFCRCYLTSPNDPPPVYLARRDALFERVHQMDYVARIQWDGSDDDDEFHNLRLQPPLPSDPPFTEAQLRAFAEEYWRRLEAANAVASTTAAGPAIGSEN